MSLRINKPAKNTGETTMLPTIFFEGIDRVFAAHGKIRVSAPVKEQIFKRVRDMPDDFMVFAEEELEDYEKLPANLGREIATVLFTAYKNRQQGIALSEITLQCPECDGRQYITAYDRIPVTTPSGKDEHPFRTLHCVCNTQTHEQRYSKNDIHKAGWLLADPIRRREYVEKIKSICGDVITDRQGSMDGRYRAIQRLREKAHEQARDF